MSSTAYGHVTIDDHNDLSGNGRLTFSVQAHTGRNARTKQFDLTNDNGDTAAIVINQTAEVIMAIDRFEDTNGNTVNAIGHAGGLYYMVGRANVNFLEATEANSTSYTDLNDMSNGEAWTNGFTITEANGTVHTGIMFESSIAYGTDTQYTFKIPVVFQKTNTLRKITFELTDDVSVVSFDIEQEAE